ncbi:MAG: hypothetical protein WDN06_19220 [Asticcacaulis sp.]
MTTTASRGVGENIASIGTDQSKVFARRIDQIDANTKRLTTSSIRLASSAW